jgi:hypothetical protein
MAVPNKGLPTLSGAASRADAAVMRIPRSGSSWRRTPAGEPDDELASSRAWRDSGLADEVEAFLGGRLVDYMTASHQPVAAWAVLNRLAHADRSELVGFVEGANIDWVVHPSSRQPYWVASERFVAGHLLALARTPEDLGRLQRAALVPLELELIERTKIEQLTADQVLELAARAVDSFSPGR